MTAESIGAVLANLGEEIDDATEETFILFSQDLPHNDLGMIDGKADSIDIEINGYEYQIAQSSGLLKSSRAAGTTGAMVWKVGPRVARWLASTDSVVWKNGLLDSRKNVLELGCGVAGIIGMTVSRSVASYILTDQSYVMKLLKENITRNTEHAKGRSKAGAGKDTNSRRGFHNLHVLTLDWELDSTQNLKDFLPDGTGIDVLVVCDCIYNSFLIQPLAQTCVDICKMSPTGSTVILIAQQLRSDDIFEEWLARFLQDFKIWRIKDDLLPTDLQSNSGYVVHMASLRSNAEST